MTFYPNPLSKKHEHQLFVESANAPEIVAERGTFTAHRGKDVPQDHGWLPKKPGSVFPVHPLDGGIFYRLRLDNPGRFPKYMQPKGHPNRLDVHPRQHERIRQPGGMRYVTEGEKKVDAGVSRGLLMVGQSGVFNGQRDKGAALIEDWDLLPIEGEKYSILYDSDIESNPIVQLAADRQARLLRERGAEVFITLLPPAPDGSKQGLDDFFANGGTVKELELLTRPYDLETVERVRLSRDEKLSTAVEDLERRFWAEEWKGQGGHSDRDVALKLIESARRYGKVVDDGIRIVKAWGPLELEAKVSRRTLAKALNRLEERGFLYRDNKDREIDKAGAFVLRASVDQYGEEPGQEGTEGQRLRVCDPGGLHLRALPDVPRLRWPRPAFTPKKRGFAKGTRRVRESKLLPARDRIERLGKIRGAILDVLDAVGGTATLQEIADALHRKRPRDIRRRNLPMLEEGGIITVEGDTVTLSDSWLDRLEEARELGQEIEADELAEENRKRKSRAYHNRHKANPDPHWTNNPDADGAIEDLRPVEAVPEEPLPEPEVSDLARAIRDYLDRSPHDACQPPGWIGVTLWAYDLCDGKPTPAEVRDAIEELGGERYLRSRLRVADGEAA